jgi:hypothetical protein
VLFLLIAAIPLHVHAQDTLTPGTATAKASERETIDFEGIRIVFPKRAADVVEQLKPALKKYREERRCAVDAEAKEIAESFSDTAMNEMLRGPVAGITPRCSQPHRRR